MSLNFHAWVGIRTYALALTRRPSYSKRYQNKLGILFCEPSSTIRAPSCSEPNGQWGDFLAPNEICLEPSHTPLVLGATRRKLLFQVLRWKAENQHKYCAETVETVRTLRDSSVLL